MRARLSKIIAFRLVVGSLLLSSAFALGISEPDTFPFNPFVFLIGLTFALSIFYLATLRLAERSAILIDLQFAVDAFLVSAFIHVTGGITSHFSSLYVLPIIAASTVRGRRGAIQVAALGATLYTGIVFAQYLDVGVVPPGWWLPPAVGLPTPGFAKYTVAINLSGMFAVALLSGSLAERLRSARAGLQDASHEIADLRAFNDHVIDCLPSGVVTADASFRILSFNRAAETITGQSAREVRDRDVRELLQLPAEFAAQLPSLDAIPARLEVGFKTAAGHVLDVGLGVMALRFPEGTPGFLFTFQNITEVKRLERGARLQQRLAAIGEMAAGIAHEIRNPLASMTGSLELLRSELPLSEEQAQLMDIALRESERLNERIQLFLAYARPERLAASRLDVRKVVQDAAHMLRNSVDVRDDHVIDLELPDEPIWYHGDEAEVRQILWSLGTNGLRAMPGGGRLLLAVRLDAKSVSGDLMLTVQDQGCGIPSEDLEAIFQPFRRTFRKGAGLGLSIVHRIVTDYGGHVEVSSTTGAGTTVTVRLPGSPAVANVGPEEPAAPRRTA
jgi:two-component system sensor histidine kinase PilS (NtrC family)